MSTKLDYFDEVEPNDASDVIEPYLRRFLDVIKIQISSYDRPPTEDEWRQWHLEIKGVSMFLYFMSPKLPFGRQFRACKTYNEETVHLDPFWCGDCFRQGHFRPNKAKRIWKKLRGKETD